MSLSARTLHARAADVLPERRDAFERKPIRVRRQLIYGTTMRSRLSTLPILLCTLLAITAAHTGATAQPLGAAGSDRKLLDGVVAVVGNEVILMSDIAQRAMLLAQQSRGQIDPNNPKFLRDLLNEVIDEKLMLTRAREDSVSIPDEEVNRQVEFRLQQLIQQAGTEKRLEEAYQMTIEQIRREARDIIRPSLQIRRLTDTRFQNLKVNDLDMREFYDLYKDSLPQMPEQVELQHILITVKPTPNAIERTIAQARSITDSIRNGGDFADFARRYSTDAGSGKAGGDLGMVRFGEFVSEFDSTVRAISVNDISGPVRTEFGIHIIQLLEMRSEEFHARHILLSIKPGESERDSVVAKLRDLRSRALAGESFADLAKANSDDDDSKGLGGSLGKLPVDQLPADLKGAVAGMSVGEISEPKPITLSPSKSGFHIVKLVRRIAPHPLDPKEDRTQLERLALQYKQSKELKKWLQDLRSEIYWDIKAAEFK